VGQELLGPSYFFISLVLGPLNSLVWYVPSYRYIWSLTPIFVSARTSKRHHHFEHRDLVLLFHKPRFLLAHIIVRLRQLGLELREICLVVQQVALVSTFSVCMCLKFARDTMNTSYILLVSVFQFCSTSTGMVSVLPSVMSLVHDSRMSAKDMHVLKGVCCCL
jgi:hypothetical protein